MRGDGLLRIVAAGAAICGVVALVTGSPIGAVVAGLLALASAGIALGRRDAAPVVPAPGSPPLDGAAIDLREPPPPAPPSAPSRPVAPVSASPVLLDVDYLSASLRGRVAVARRALRPLSVVHIMILGGQDGGPVPAELIAAAAEATLRESDIVGRTRDGIYVVVLEDTGEDGAVWTTERLRRHIAGTIGPQRFQAGVASYPSHGLDAESVDASAARALAAAQEWDRDRIEVAVH